MDCNANQNSKKKYLTNTKHFLEVLLIVVFVVGILAAVFLPNYCSERCQVARFSNSNEVTLIVNKFMDGSLGGLSREILMETKNQPPIPSVSNYFVDENKRLIINSFGDSVILTIRHKFNGAQCVDSIPKVDIKWCSLRDGLQNSH